MNNLENSKSSSWGQDREISQNRVVFLHTRLLFCTVRVEELLDGIKEQIPTFQGVKFSDMDLLDLAQCINKNEREQFTFLYGVDEVRDFP